MRNVGRIPGTNTRPPAGPLSPELIESLSSAVAPETGGVERPEGICHGSHNCAVQEMRLRAGRTLVVEPGRYRWSAPRLHAARLASELLKHRAGVLAPAPLEKSPDHHPGPIEGCPRVELPTLQDIRLGASEARAAGLSSPEARAARERSSVRDQSGSADA